MQSYERTFESEFSDLFSLSLTFLPVAQCTLLHTNDQSLLCRWECGNIPLSQIFPCLLIPSFVFFHTLQTNLSYVPSLQHTNYVLYRGANKGLHVLLSRTQAGPGRTVKQEQKEMSHNHVQTYLPLCTHCSLTPFVLGKEGTEKLPHRRHNNLHNNTLMTSGS